MPGLTKPAPPLSPRRDWSTCCSYERRLVPPVCELSSWPRWDVDVHGGKRTEQRRYFFTFSLLCIHPAVLVAVVVAALQQASWAITTTTTLERIALHLHCPLLPNTFLEVPRLQVESTKHSSSYLFSVQPPTTCLVATFFFPALLCTLSSVL